MRARLVTLRADTNGTQIGSIEMIQLDDDDNKAVHVMIRFLYDQRYDLSFEASGVKRHARVYIIAAKYGVEGLEAATLNSVLNSLFCHQNRSTEVKDKDVIEAIKILWEGTKPDETVVRPQIAAHCASDIKDLCEHPKFLKLMRSTDLGSDICIAIAKQKNKEEEMGHMRWQETRGMGEEQAWALNSHENWSMPRSLPSDSLPVKSGRQEGWGFVESASATSFKGDRSKTPSSKSSLWSMASSTKHSSPFASVDP